MPHLSLSPVRTLPCLWVGLCSTPLLEFELCSALPLGLDSAPLSLPGLLWMWNSSCTNTQGWLEVCIVQGQCTLSDGSDCSQAWYNTGSLAVRDLRLFSLVSPLPGEIPSIVCPVNYSYFGFPLCQPMWLCDLHSAWGLPLQVFTGGPHDGWCHTRWMVSTVLVMRLWACSSSCNRDWCFCTCCEALWRCLWSGWEGGRESMHNVALYVCWSSASWIGKRSAWASSRSVGMEHSAPVMYIATALWTLVGFVVNPVERGDGIVVSDDSRIRCTS